VGKFKKSLGGIMNTVVFFISTILGAIVFYVLVFGGDKKKEG